MDREDLNITVLTLIDDLLPSVMDGQRLRQRGPSQRWLTARLSPSNWSASSSAITRIRHASRIFAALGAISFRACATSTEPPSCAKRPTSGPSRNASGNCSSSSSRTTSSWPSLTATRCRSPIQSVLDGAAVSAAKPPCRDYATKATRYGFRVHLRVEWPSVISRVVVAPANDAEPSLLPHLLDGVPGYVLGDRGYWNPERMAELRALGTALVAPFRRKRSDPWPELSRWLSRKRYRIETVISQLVGRFASRAVWARDGWHLWNRLLRAILIRTVAVWLNRQAGHPPLQFVHLAPKLTSTTRTGRL